MTDEAPTVDETTVRQGYDELEGAYADTRLISEPEQALLDRCCQRLPSDALVLDAGCGPGTPVLASLTDHASAVGLDLSREQLRRSRTNAPAAALAQAEMSRLPIATNAVDAVVALHSLIHIPLADHLSVIEEFARVLAPGGMLLLTEGPEEWTGSNSDWLDEGVEMQWEIAGQETTTEQLRAAGFELQSVVDSGHELGASDERWIYREGRQSASGLDPEGECRKLH